jgi:hypothetical protein
MTGPLNVIAGKNLWAGSNQCFAATGPPRWSFHLAPPENKMTEIEFRCRRSMPLGGFSAIMG